MFYFLTILALIYEFFKRQTKEGTGLNEFTIVDSTHNKQMTKWVISNCVVLLAMMLQQHMCFQFLVGYPRTVIFLQSYELKTWHISALCSIHLKNLNNTKDNQMDCLSILRLDSCPCGRGQLKHKSLKMTTFKAYYHVTEYQLQFFL